MSAAMTLLISVSMAMVALLPSCSGDKTADAEDILATIPSDASAVAVINLGSILDKAGCKVDGDKITPSADVSAAAAKIRNKDVRLLVQSLLAGESGIDPSLAVLFRQGYYNYITGMLSTPADFKAMVEKNLGLKFTGEEGVDIAANIAVTGDRFWVNIDQHAVDPNEIRHFTALDRNQSFLSNKFADNMCKVSKDIEGWGNITGIVNTLDMGFQQRATVQIALQTIFEDPQSVSFSAGFDKNRFAAEATVLNSKGAMAKYQFTPGKIDVKTVESIGGDATSVIAVDIPARMVSDLKKQTESKSPSMLGIVLGSMGCVDGTAAYATGSTDRGVISTDGKDTSALTQMLSQADVTVEKQDRLLRVTGKSTPDAPKGVPVSQLAAGLDGAIAGVAYRYEPGRLFTSAATAVMTLTSKGDGLRISLDMTADDKKENIVLSLF